MTNALLCKFRQRSTPKPAIMNNFWYHCIFIYVQIAIIFPSEKTKWQRVSKTYILPTYRYIKLSYLFSIYVFQGIGTNIYTTPSTKYLGG